MIVLLFIKNYIKGGFVIAFEFMERHPTFILHIAILGAMQAMAQESLDKCVNYYPNLMTWLPIIFMTQSEKLFSVSK